MSVLAKRPRASSAPKVTKKRGILLTVPVFEDDGVLLDLRPDEGVLDVPDGVVRVGPHQPQGPPRRVHYPRLVHLAQGQLTLEGVWGRDYTFQARWTTR